jgi:hypothetical protein
MSDLRNSIQSLAETFAAGVLQAIRSASLEDILAEGALASKKLTKKGEKRATTYFAK